MKSLPHDRRGWDDPLIINLDSGEIIQPARKISKLPKQKKLYPFPPTTIFPPPFFFFFPLTTN
jgi:hypothetical protein